MSAPAQSLPEPLPNDPLPLATAWLKEAWERRVQPNPDAMALATVNAGGLPSVRMVLCKEIVPAPGYLLFYTNYESRKGRDLAAQPRAAAVLFWDELQRQVRVEGPVVRAAAAESDAYFATRAWQSRVGAWGSRQSQPIASRQELLDAVRAAGQRLGTPDALEAPQIADARGEVKVPRPPHWGGYRLWAEKVELWVGGEFRIHDRAQWTRTLTPRDALSFTPGSWSATRLQP